MSDLDLSESGAKSSATESVELTAFGALAKPDSSSTAENTGKKKQSTPDSPDPEGFVEISFRPGEGIRRSLRSISLEESARRSVSFEPAPGAEIPRSGSSDIPPPPSYEASVSVPGGEAYPRPRRSINMGLSSGQVKIGLVVLGIAALLLVILLPMSYGDLEYYEMGFKKSKVGGSVDTSKVYLGGRHFIGVDKTFKKFRADAHVETFTRFSIYNTEKIQVSMTCSLQYFLRPEDLNYLHDAFDINYKPVLRKTVAAAIKNAASQYSIEDYRLNRLTVAAGLEDAAAKALGGTCCRIDCSVFQCRKGCIPYSQCNSTVKGGFADLRYFQMQMVDITADQEKRFLLQVLEQEKKDTEVFKQNETVTRKETERLRKEIENEALEIRQTADARAALVKAKAEAEAKATVEGARNSGMQIVFDALGIKDEQHKKALDYVRTLGAKKNANLYVGFQTLVARP